VLTRDVPWQAGISEGSQRNGPTPTLTRSMNILFSMLLGWKGKQFLKLNYLVVK